MEVVQEVGLADLTYRLVGERLNIADRTVVYYFPTKRELLDAVLEVVEHKVGDAMLAQLGEGPLTVEQAVVGMWRALATPEIDSIFRVYIELFGLAAARRSPYDEVMSRVGHKWLDWLAQRMMGSLDERRAGSAATFAQVDGMLLLRHVVSPKSADMAASLLVSPRQVNQT